MLGRCDGIGYMGFRQSQRALQCSFEERNSGCAPSTRQKRLFPTLAWTRYYRACVPAVFERILAQHQGCGPRGQGNHQAGGRLLC